MDFSKLEFVEKANPRNSLDSNYDIKVTNWDKATFQITEYAFDKYGFGTRGAIQINGEGEVFIAAVTNDKAVFLKKTNKGNVKNRRFKNVKLLQKLKELGFKDDFIHMKFVETYNDMHIYKLYEGIRDEAENTATAAQEDIKAEKDPQVDESADVMPEPESVPAPPQEDVDAEEWDDDPF